MLHGVRQLFLVLNPSDKLSVIVMISASIRFLRAPFCSQAAVAIAEGRKPHPVTGATALHLALGPRLRPRPRPLPISLRLHAHASTYAARQPEAPPPIPFRLSLLDRRTPALRSWCVSRLVSFAVGVNQIGIRLGKLREGGRSKLAKAGLLDCLRKCRE